MKRSEQRVEDTWAIEDMYPNIESWKKEFTSLKEDIKYVENYRGNLLKPKELFKYFEATNDISKRLEKLYVYIDRLYDTDTNNNAVKELLGDISNFGTEIQESFAFVDVELKALTEDILEEFYKEEPRLKNYSRSFESILKNKKHVLTEEIEKLLGSMSIFAGASSQIYSVFTDSELKFESIKDENGEDLKVEESSYGVLMENKNRDIRKAAFESIMNGYGKYENTISTMFDLMLKEVSFSIKTNKYESPLNIGTEPDEIPESVYTNLIQTMHNNLGILHRYTALRKKYLGLENIHLYDLALPLSKESNKKYSFEEAKNIVLNGLKPLGEDYLNLLRKGFNERWIDIYPNDAKTNGAYSSGEYSTHPYVLMNYTNTLSEVSTLAHEMGHAMHSYLSAKNQPYQYHDYSIFVAEVASTCNEALLIQELLKKAETKEDKIYLLDNFMNHFRTTVYRQTMFAEFELIVHNKAFEGETMTAEKLNKIYKDLVELYYGKDVVIDDCVKHEWSRIPHFYSPFYVYKYATGFSAAIALSQRILNGTEKEKNEYLEFLSGGCSKTPIELLKGAGVDMSTSKPIQDALNFFNQLLDEFESLINKE